MQGVRSETGAGCRDATRSDPCTMTHRHATSTPGDASARPASSTPTWSSCPCAKTTTSRMCPVWHRPPAERSLAARARGAFPGKPYECSCFGTQGTGWQSPRAAARRRRRRPASCTTDTLRRMAIGGGLAARQHRLGAHGGRDAAGTACRAEAAAQAMAEGACWPTTTAPRSRPADHARAWLESVELRVLGAAPGVEAAARARRDPRRGHQPGARARQRAGQPR